MKIKDLKDVILALFRKNNDKQEEISPSNTETGWDIVIYCDNPECKNPIGGKFAAYDAIQRKIYHPYCECELYASAHPTMYQDVVFTAAEYIPMKTAIEFYNERKLAQSTALNRLIEYIGGMEKKSQSG